MHEEIKKIIKETIDGNWLVKINKQLYLKKYQMDILNLHHIDYQKCNSVSELLFLIEETLETDGKDELLEEVASSLQEFNYYNNTNK